MPSGVAAFEVKHAPGGELVRWSRPSVAWTIDRSMRDVAGGEAAVSNAADAWTQQGGAPALAVTATDAKLEPGLDGVNGVFFVEGGYEPAGNALAITILSYDERTGDILDTDIVLNGRYHFGPVGYDIRRVIAHEMGHALGLSDEPADATALMYPYVARAVALSTVPAVDDVAGLTMLYGSASRVTSAPLEAGGDDATRGGRASSNGPSCTSSVVPPAGPRAATRHGFVAVGLGLLAVRWRRARAAHLR